MTVEHAASAPRPLGRGTLGRQLLVRVVALVASAALLLGALTTVATQELLIRQVDKQLGQVTDRMRRQSDDPGGRGLLESGQPLGTIYAAYRSDGSSFSAERLADRRQRPDLPEDA